MFSKIYISPPKKKSNEDSLELPEVLYNSPEVLLNSSLYHRIKEAQLVPVRDCHIIMPFSCNEEG